MRPCTFGRPRKAGFILLDSLIGASILGLGCAAFWMLLPTVNRSQVMSQHRARASQIASRMAEELQSLSVTTCTGANLQAQNLIDTTSPTTSPFTFSNIPLDQNTQYNPSVALPKGTGTITLSTQTGGSVMATITVGWTEVTGQQMSHTTATIIGGYR